MDAKKTGKRMRRGAIVVAVLATLFPTGCATTSSSGPVPVTPGAQPAPDSAHAVVAPHPGS
ncbi:MAG: hypothetical protein ACLP4W_07355 [Mycobacterium sp.]|uniref:hypothetical protein n=1 Tax=Mycobacterium sp. TaxID=1785 RepID=UPI003F9C7681